MQNAKVISSINFIIHIVSHHSSSLTASKKNAESRGARRMITSISAAASPVDTVGLHRLPTMGRTLSMLKTNAVARGRHGVLKKRSIWSPYLRSKVSYNAIRTLQARTRVIVPTPGTHKGFCANALVICGVCKEIVWRSWRGQCVLDMQSVQCTRCEYAVQAL